MVTARELRQAGPHNRSPVNASRNKESSILKEGVEWGVIRVDITFLSHKKGKGLPSQSPYQKSVEVWEDGRTAVFHGVHIVKGTQSSEKKT